MRNLKDWMASVWFWIVEPLLYALAFILVLAAAGTLDARAAAPTREQLEIHAAKVEAEFELPAGLLRAICEQESHWRNVAGQQGEIGVCQLKPDTVLMICNCKDNAAQVFIQRGSRGDHVRRVQATLVLWGFSTVKVDGVFGPDTERAVLAFQRGIGAKPDGVVGPLTWALLFRGEPYPGGTIAVSLWNPYKNVEWAAAYLVWLIEQLETDNPAVLMAAYNGGPANPVVKYVVSVQRRMARGSM